MRSGYGSAVILSDHNALLAKCEAEGLKRRSRSKLKFLMEFDYLSGLSNLQAGPELSAVSLNELKNRALYCAHQAEALIWHACKQNLKITGAEEDFQTLSDERDKVGGVKKLMDAYAKVKKPKNKRPSLKTNQTTTYKGVLTAVTSGYATTDRTGYRQYKSDPAKCLDCPLLASCTSSANATKVVTRHVWQTLRDKIDGHRLTDWGKRIYGRRKETVERSFADAKQLHGHRYARYRGIPQMKEQCLLAAAAQNIKKIALAITGSTAPA